MVDFCRRPKTSTGRDKIRMAQHRALIYARYSSDQQRDASIDDQVRICRARAEREGWRVEAVFSDHAISGTTLLRPGYQALLAHLRTPGADIVLAESLDRFSRDQEHIAAFYKQVTFARSRIFTLAEGEVSELHIGLKGTMGALYLKDLAAKTHRGLEGRIRAGRCVGTAPYGYRIVRKLAQNGEPERGLREIDEIQAVVVRRIFASYASGSSPRSIARSLNDEAVPGPAGGIWNDTAIRGRAQRGDGLLRNPLYAGRLVWNRLHNTKDPIHGTRVRRVNPAADIVVHAMPELGIVDTALWESVQERLTLEAAPVQPTDGPASSGRFWERRRPRHLLSSKVICGVCGRTFSRIGKDYLACTAATQNGCINTARPRRLHLEAQVLDALGRQLMQPDLVEAFIQEFTATWRQTIAEATGSTDQIHREMQVVEKRIGNLVDALADGLRGGDIQKRLDGLEQRRGELALNLTAPVAVMPDIPADLATVYHDELTKLRLALIGPDGSEALEAARGLIDRIVISPPRDGDELAEIELIGNLAGMLQAGGFRSGNPKRRTSGAEVFSVLECSVKGGLRALPLDPATLFS